MLINTGVIFHVVDFINKIVFIGISENVQCGENFVERIFRVALYLIFVIKFNYFSNPCRGGCLAELVERLESKAVFIKM